jgi:hypothetical protein
MLPQAWRPALREPASSSARTTGRLNNRYKPRERQKEIQMKKVTIRFFDTVDHGTAIYYLERGLCAWGILGDIPSGNGDWAEIGPDALIARAAREYHGPKVGQFSRWNLGRAEIVSVDDVGQEAAQRIYASLGRAAARAAASAADDAQRRRWAEKNAAEY